MAILFYVVVWIVLGLIVLNLNRQACSVISMLDGDGAKGAALMLLIPLADPQDDHLLRGRMVRRKVPKLVI